MKTQKGFLRTCNLWAYCAIVALLTALLCLPCCTKAQYDAADQEEETGEELLIPEPLDTLYTDTSAVEIEEPSLPVPFVDEKEEQPQGIMAHAIGFGLCTANFTKTIKHGGDSLNTSEEIKGYNGVYFHYRMVKPEAKIYFSPNIVYSYKKKEVTVDDTALDSYRRYLFLAGNVGLNINELIRMELIVETFLEGGLGVLVMEDGTKQGDNNWHFLLLGMDLVAGGRYWISPDFGVEATFRYVNCFVDSGLDSEETDVFITFNDFMFGFGIVVKP